ncbi:unnamed protein product [Microthlaspi erraticum]|uniref:DC1 domain-containing protein n=1 Tax=Microthlaspi erraticum TaxID=1685480 RepID=A0A6D2I0T9_9BRAS|nr:unnamed protein product [Microthlaspi erraticum]
MDSDPESELLLLITEITAIGRSADPDSKLGAVRLRPQLVKRVWGSREVEYPEVEAVGPQREKRLFTSMDPDLESELASLMTRIISLVNSMDLDSLPKPETEIISLIKKTISLFGSVSASEPESELVSLVTQMISLGSDSDSKSELMVIMDLADAIFSLTPEPEMISLINQIISLVSSKKLSLELKLKSVVTQINSYLSSGDSVWQPKPESNLVSLIKQIAPLVNSMGLDQTKPKSELISLTSQIITRFNSIAESKPESELVSLVSQITPLVSSSDSETQLLSIIYQLLYLKMDTKLLSLTNQISSLVRSMNSERKQMISLCPQAQVKYEDSKFHVTGKVPRQGSNARWRCPPSRKYFPRIPTENYTAYFRCKDCNGEDHEEYVKAPVEVKHSLHRKHSLQLVWYESPFGRTRECYCCDEDLLRVFYYCSACDYAMNVACLEKQPPWYVDHPKWHEHTLVLFPRPAFLTCDVCALADSSSPIYMCPSCDFVIHLRCINLPRVIRISRHRHRISFTPSFDKGDWFCCVCRKKINNDCGGYSCINNACLYTTHSRCATQSNVWDGIELEGEPEDIEEEEMKTFVRISSDVIQHFSHPQHHLRLDENTDRDYDENKHCQACIMPIYFGNFYFCMQCDFFLHETCANLSRRIHHPIHPHLLTLVSDQYDGVMDHSKNLCSACNRMCKTGFFYGCGKEGCLFKLHVQCATTSEPLVHKSHKHPLFLTSKPGERRRVCGVCKSLKQSDEETFNCIECDFALCFGCATLPENVRYKHDKHMLTLSYGNERSTVMYWCEVCELKVDPTKRFYTCDDYCCVTLHIECLLGQHVYMKPGLTLIDYLDLDIDVLPNHVPALLTGTFLVVLSPQNKIKRPTYLNKAHQN